MENKLLNTPVKYSTKINISPSSIHKLNPEFSLCDIDVMYVDENRNGTDISRDVVEDAIYSLYGVPIVGEWLDDEERFGDHGEKIEISKNKITCTVTTKPIGFVTQEAIDTATWIEKPLPNGHEVKTWLHLKKCILWTGRYEEAQSIIDNGTFQSMEVKFQDGEYLKSGIFKPSKMIFSALCAIGVEPCFEEANIRRAEYEMDSFKAELKMMLDEYKKFNKEPNNNPKGEQKMDLTKFNNLLSEIKVEGKESLRYELLSADDTKIYVFDKSENYKLFAVEYAMDGENPIINWNTKTEGDIAFTEKSEKEESHMVRIYQEVFNEIRTLTTAEFEVKLDEKIQEVSNEVTEKFNNLQTDYDTLKASYSIAKDKLDKYEAIEAERAKQEHIETVKGIVDKFEKRIGKHPNFLFYKAKLDFEKADLDTVEKDLTLMSGDILMGKKNAAGFSYQPQETRVKHYSKEDAISKRYGNLLDKFIN